MSKITEISVQEKNKKRCNIYIDGEFFRGVSMESVYKFRLKVGEEIDEKRLSEIIAEAERSEAMDKALNYISRALKTKKQLKTYLEGKGYSEEIVWKVVDKLKEYGYIDDVEYSKRFIESTGKTQGKRLLSYKLMMKGVKKEDIEEAYEEKGQDALSNAEALADKRLKNKEITFENVQKTYRYLISRGFSYEEAENAVRKYKGED